MIAVEPEANLVSSNIRYALAKKQMEGLFVKWLSLQSTTKLVQQLIIEVQKPNGTIVFLIVI